MAAHSPGDEDARRAMLTPRQSRWLALTGADLPAAAADRGFPVRADHCFQRILLDHACGGCWYDHVPARPAWRHASPDLLARAVALGEAVLAGTADLHRLNTRSLAWRGKRPPSPRNLDQPTLSLHLESPQERS